jgi:hypothetical protein
MADVDGTALYLRRRRQGAEMLWNTYDVPQKSDKKGHGFKVD